ncbi:MAG: hypothetical protein ABIZ80_18915 [Bryobacteraceae bacterium]
MYIVGTYIAYLIVSLTATVWVASTLHKRGRIFLVDSYRGNEAMADSVNHLLVVGFYLINIGYVTLALRTAGSLYSLRESIEMLSDKVGIVLVVLGAMHFFNLYIFSRLRRKGLESNVPPPFPPDAVLGAGVRP